jgi:CRISPR-associated endonuclease/helicase Cas3
VIPPHSGAGRNSVPSGLADEPPVPAEDLDADDPLAKSGRDPKHWKPSEAFGYPRGLRHEFVSVRLFEQSRKSETVDTDLLVKLLIGTHHGHGRAFAPVVKDPRPVDVTLAHDGQQISTSSDHRLYRLASGWTDLFWKMVHLYGWWGLSFLEALLVTADRAVSAREQRNESHGEVATK